MNYILDDTDKEYTGTLEDTFIYKTYAFTYPPFTDDELLTTQNVIVTRKLAEMSDREGGRLRENIYIKFTEPGTHILKLNSYALNEVFNYKCIISAINPPA